jgi:cell division protein FtsW
MKKIFMKMDKPLLFITLAFFIFGLIMVLSASSMESYMRYGYSPYYYFVRQAAFLIGGSVIFLITINIPSKFFRKISFLLIVATIGVLVALQVYGNIAHVAKNARSWISIGPVSIQPSEFAKVFVILFLANYYDKNKDKLTNIWSLIKPLIPCVVIVGLVAIQPDLGTAGIITLLSVLLFYAIPLKDNGRKIINRLLVLGIILVVGLFVVTKGSFLKGYQLKRFNFLDPCDRYQEETGYQLCNSFIAFTNGGLTGQGLGKSTQKYLYLPESYTDFIFPIIVEELGLIVGIIIILTYLFILYRLFKISRNSNSLYNSLVAYGVCSYIFLHLAINFIGVMGIGPLTGVPLPFLSYGGSYTISLMFALGLVQRVAIENNKESIKKKKKIKK